MIAGWLRRQRRSNNSPTRTVWRFHVPRIWIGSINPCGLSVKRKSQNLDNFFPTRPYLVVPLRAKLFSLSTFSSRLLLLNCLQTILYAFFGSAFRSLFFFSFFFRSILAIGPFEVFFFAYDREKILYSRDSQCRKGFGLTFSWCAAEHR